MTTYEQVQKKKIPIIPYENFEELKDDTSNNAPIFAFDNKKVTLKLLVNEKCDKQGIKKLLLELRQFDHENILKTYGLTKVNMNYYFVRECTNNLDLRTYLRKNSQISWEDKVELIRQVVVGLKFLHDKKIIHVELHPENILIHDSVPKLTSIGVSKINTPDGFPFTPYKPPELLTSQQLNKQKDGTKLNIFSLGVLFWEVSNNGNPPFNNRFDITLVVKVIDGFRESPIKGTPNKYVEIYIKCWDGNPDERPSCNDILEELKEISYEDVDKNLVQEQDRVPDPEDTPLSPDITPDDAFDLNTEHLLDFDFLEQERERKKVFVKRFGLTKGRNRDGYDFVPGAKHILDDNGTFNTEKIEHFTPIVYLAKVNTEPWGFLNKFTLFPRKDKKVPYGVDFIRIHIPVADVEYEGHLTDEFIHEIKDALEILDNQEKRTKLKEIFTEYGNYIITKFTIGGAIMIDAHDIDDESLLRFQVYLKWGINFAKGETHAIFENGLLEGFPRFETFPSRPMDNVKDLYTWLKNLHDCQDVELILYKSYKPFYELLDNNFKDLKEKIFECFSLNSFNPADELPILIPQLPPEFEQETFSEWTSSSKSSLLPYVRDWSCD